jgi:hypothetical protein
MYAYMDFQVLFSGERSATNFAAIRFLSSMRVNMNDETFSTRHSLSTYRTSRFSITMNFLDVATVTHSRVERLATYFTLVERNFIWVLHFFFLDGFLALVNILNMFENITFVFELGIT